MRATKDRPIPRSRVSGKFRAARATWIIARAKHESGSRRKEATKRLSFQSPTATFRRRANWLELRGTSREEPTTFTPPVGVLNWQYDTCTSHEEPTTFSPQVSVRNWHYDTCTSREEPTTFSPPVGVRKWHYDACTSREEPTTFTPPI